MFQDIVRIIKNLDSDQRPEIIEKQSKMEDMEFVETDGPNKGDDCFEVISKTTVRKKEKRYKAMRTILANNPITTLKYRYFEVSLRERDYYSSFNKELAVGLAAKNIKVEKWPGDESDEPAVAYHYDDGNIHVGGDGYQTSHDAAGIEDVIGCGIGSNGMHFFTTNGELMKIFSPNHPNCVYPLITIGDTDIEVVVNFGQENFMYDFPAKFSDDWSNKIWELKNSGNGETYSQFSDFTIASGDEEEFPCHRIILAMRSSVLREKIESESEDERKIQLDYDSKIVKKMIDFIYTDVIDDIENLEEATIEDLWAIAGELNITELKKILHLRYNEL